MKPLHITWGLGAVLSLLLLAPLGAHAQAPVRTLVVELVSGDAPSVSPVAQETLAQATVEALASVHQAPTFLGSNERRRLAAVAGVTLSPVASAEVARLQRSFNQVLEAVALGHNQRALRLANRIVFPRRGSWLPHLASDSTAETLGDICLFSVRALQQLSRADEAYAQAERCLDVIPDLRASSRWHPDDVRALWGQARRASSQHRLVLRSDVDGPCRYSVSGRPVTGSEAKVRGPAVTVGVQCGEDPSPLWFPVSVAATPEQVLTFPVRFARAAHLSEFGLRLQYPSDEARLQHGDQDVKRAAVSMHAAQVVVVQRTTSTRAHITHLLRPSVASLEPLGDQILDLDDRAALMAFFRSNLQAAKTKALAEATASADAQAHADAAPVSADGPSGNERPQGSRISPDDGITRASILGWSLAGTGLAAYGAGWFLYTRWLQQHRTVSATPADSEARDSAVRASDRTSLIAAITAASGGLLLTASVPLLLADQNLRSSGVPYWSWALGGLGLGAVGGGLYILSTEGSCVAVECTATRKQGPLGVLLIAGAAPLIAMPIAHALGATRPTHVALSPLFRRDANRAVLDGATLGLATLF